MANREEGELSLTIKGRTYTLVLNTGAMAALEDLFSTPSQDVLWDTLWARVLRGSVRTVRGLIWAMLQTHHPDVTLKAAGQLIDDAGGFAGLTAVLQQAGVSAVPDAQDVADLGVPNNPPAARVSRRRGTGAGSTSTRGGSASVGRSSGR